MRIISGLFKGKKILSPINLQTRPLKDLVKESIFNIINHSPKLLINIQNSTILDLFSGVGSFGLECLSRGSKHVTFFENYNGVLPILKKNLKNLKLNNKYEIIEKDLFNEDSFTLLSKKFDIIFIDPPYKNKNLSFILKSIFRNKILNNNGVLIIHRHIKENDVFIPEFKIIDEKKYGISKIIFGTTN